MFEEMIIKELREGVAKLKRKNKRQNAEIRRLVTELRQKGKEKKSDFKDKPEIKTETKSEDLYKCIVCGKDIIDYPSKNYCSFSCLMKGD